MTTISTRGPSGHALGRPAVAHRLPQTTEPARWKDGGHLGQLVCHHRRSPTAQKAPRYRSMTAREAYKRPLDGPGRPQDGPRSLKTAQECPKWDVAHVPCMRGCMLCILVYLLFKCSYVFCLCVVYLFACFYFKCCVGELPGPSAHSQGRFLIFGGPPELCRFLTILFPRGLSSFPRARAGSPGIPSAAHSKFICYVG